MAKRDNLGTIGGTNASEVIYISARNLVNVDGDFESTPTVISEEPTKLSIDVNSALLNDQDVFVNGVLHPPGTLFSFRGRRLGQSEGEYGILISYETPNREETKRFTVTLAAFV
jgi:hypothetical protein